MSCKSFLAFLLLSFTLSGTAFAQTETGDHGAGDQHETPEHHATGKHEADGGKKLDVAGEMFSHVGDAHEWHIFTAGETHVTVPLPVILYSPTGGLSVFSSSRFGHMHPARLSDGKEGAVSGSYAGYHLERGIKEKVVADDGAGVYDLSITKNVLCMLISIAILLLIMFSVAGKYKKNGVMKAPSGLQNAIEPVITFMRDEVAKPNLGHSYMRYMPLLLTIFFFIWINNMLGLLPFGFNFTGNIAVTLCLAIISFVVMIASANKHFWSHLFNPPGVPMGINVLLVLIEVISLFVKPVALTIRLFANILAGHIVILSVIFMIFIFGSISKVAGIGFIPVSVAFAIFMFFLELLVAAIQAFIFANLTAVFIGQAIEEAHHDDAHGHIRHQDGNSYNEVTGQHYEVAREEVIA